MTGEEEEDERSRRRRRLRRVQGLALGLLLLMGALFLLSSLLQNQAPLFRPLRAVSEAGLVGACADWFAVYALFRRPFGLNIPHTAIIPANKARIGRALGRFLVENFLSEDVLEERLRALEVGAWGGRWLQEEANAARLARGVVGAVSELGQSLPEGVFGELLGSAGLAAARAAPLAPAAGAALSAVWREGRAQPLVEAGARVLQRFLDSHEEVILAKVQEQSWAFVPDFVDRAIARRITEGLIRLLGDVQNPAHPWREALSRSVDTLLERLQADPELQEAGEALKLRLLQDPRLEVEARRLWGLLAERVAGAAPDDRERLIGQVSGLLGRLGGWLEHEPAVQGVLNEAARTLATQTLLPRRDQIARFIAEVVDGWDPADIVERLELQVGPDLQYIRINGTLVGSLIGLILYVLGKALPPL